MTGHDYVWFLFVISVVRSAGIGVRGPAVLSLIPSIVPAERLARVNGIRASIRGIMKLAAPALAGGFSVLNGLWTVLQSCIHDNFRPACGHGACEMADNT